MNRWLFLLCCALLAGCAQAPLPTPMQAPGTLLHDAAMAPPSKPIDATDVFRASDAMMKLIAEAKSKPAYLDDPRQRLIDLLYRGNDNVGIDYDASITHNAAETFQARAGNCLSLMIMTASFARQMNLDVQFRSIDVDEAWSRNGDLYFASGHVNLSLERPRGKARIAGEMDHALVIDFLPAAAIRAQRAHPISEATVLAMFMNNRAAESLARGALVDAYWYAREALLQDPRFLMAYNTLGVIYQRQGQPEWARAVYQAVLEREPENLKAMGNLVGALQALGRTDEATQLAARLARLEPFPPYHYFNAGIEAMRAQNYADARDLFSKEVARQAYNPEFHFWLAQADFRLGRVREARRHMELAVQNSITPQDHAIYAAKLDWLRGQNTH